MIRPFRWLFSTKTKHVRISRAGVVRVDANVLVQTPAVREHIRQLDELVAQGVIKFE